MKKNDESLSISPIGFVRTPYAQPSDAPHQPSVDDRVDSAVVELLPHKNFEQALADFDGIDRIWLITWLHLVESWKPMVLTPRDRKKRGVFATRSPHRPNPIGMSVVELQKIEGLQLFVRGTDLLDGTPVLDIKPYIPYADSHPTSGTGWIPALTESPFTVTWPVENVDPHVKAYAERVLAFDPLPHPYKRIAVNGEGGYVLAYKWFRVFFCLEKQSVVVTHIEIENH
ncbi:MAG: tRNA (N6-threonylcarbamoyladenosine(37)-N6)-methyltransferase TrmO [Ignavibacteria bacterium]|nr:tRNA (N6-threonylcarbamoyladenosine(37)-N6)-methyltransferase TrmO [Ignavibacteria bacterium]